MTKNLPIKDKPFLCRVGIHRFWDTGKVVETSVGAGGWATDWLSKKMCIDCNKIRLDGPGEAF